MSVDVCAIIYIYVYTRHLYQLQSIAMSGVSQTFLELSVSSIHPYFFKKCNVQMIYIVIAHTYEQLDF